MDDKPVIHKSISEVIVINPDPQVYCEPRKHMTRSRLKNGVVIRIPKCQCAMCAIKRTFASVRATDRAMAKMYPAIDLKYYGNRGDADVQFTASDAPVEPRVLRKQVRKLSTKRRPIGETIVTVASVGLVLYAAYRLIKR